MLLHGLASIKINVNALEENIYMEVVHFVYFLSHLQVTEICSPFFTTTNAIGIKLVRWT